MLESTVLNLFLYFPEDKTEYIPAVITMIIFLIITIVVWRLIIKFSNKELEKTKELEEKLQSQENEKRF